LVFKVIFRRAKESIYKLGGIVEAYTDVSKAVDELVLIEDLREQEAAIRLADWEEMGVIGSSTLKLKLGATLLQNTLQTVQSI
jgi:hypothetical protein